jgi:hypothetical protein
VVPPASTTLPAPCWASPFLSHRDQHVDSTRSTIACRPPAVEMCAAASQQLGCNPSHSVAALSRPRVLTPNDLGKLSLAQPIATDRAPPARTHSPLVAGSIVVAECACPGSRAWATALSVQTVRYGLFPVVGHPIERLESGTVVASGPRASPTTKTPISVLPSLS